MVRLALGRIFVFFGLFVAICVEIVPLHENASGQKGRMAAYVEFVVSFCVFNVPSCMYVTDTTNKTQ